MEHQCLFCNMGLDKLIDKLRRCIILQTVLIFVLYTQTCRTIILVTPLNFKTNGALTMELNILKLEMYENNKL